MSIFVQRLCELDTLVFSPFLGDNMYAVRKKKKEENCKFWMVYKSSESIVDETFGNVSISRGLKIMENKLTNFFKNILQVKALVKFFFYIILFIKEIKYLFIYVILFHSS